MTGYRAFSYEFVRSFPVLSKGFEIETEMTIHAVDKNFKLVEVPVTYRDRPVGSVSKLNTYSDGIKVLKTIATLFKEYKPGMFFSIIGTIFLILSLIFGIPVVIEYFKIGLVPRFPTLIVACIFLLISLLLYITGIILQVIVKKHRQLYELYHLRTCQSRQYLLPRRDTYRRRYKQRKRISDRPDKKGCQRLQIRREIQSVHRGQNGKSQKRRGNTWRGGFGFVRRASH